MAAAVRRDLFIGQLSPGKDGGPPFKVSNGHCERLGLAVAQRHEERARIVLRGPRSKLRKENEDAVQIEFTLPALRATLYKSLKRSEVCERIEREGHQADGRFGSADGAI